MARRPDQATRDRAIWLVRLVTLGAVGGAVGASWGLGALAEAYFSGRPPAPPPAPNIPRHAAPVQKAPEVIVSVVHHPYRPGQQPPSGSNPRPPSQAPGAPPPPPPPAACHSTPSKPC